MPLGADHELIDCEKNQDSETSVFPAKESNVTIEPLNALVVDDDVISRKTVGFNLEQEGFHCAYSEGALDALSQLEMYQFDLVVTDLCMPNMHGHTLAVEILSRPNRPLVIVHSGITDPRMTRELISRGVDDVIYKPTNYSGFAAKAFVWASRHRLASTAAVKDDAIHANQPTSTMAVDMFFSATSDSLDFSDIGRKVQMDPGLSAAILAVANSTGHNQSGNKITDVLVALRRIGMKKVADLALDQIRATSANGH